MTFTVYAELAPEVSKKLDRLAKKAERYEIPFSYTVSEEHPQTVAVRDVDHATQTIHTVNTYTVAAVDFDVECDGLIRANGWTVRAKIEHGENGNIVTGFGTAEVNREWYKAPARCDHCRSNRFRSVTFICEKDGEMRQVGRTCLHDYTGISPATAAMWAEIQDLMDRGTDCTRSEWEDNRPTPMHDVLSILAHACDTIREFGYRKSAETNSTRDMVTKRVMSNEEPSAEALDRAADIRDWLIGRNEKAAADDAELRELWDLHCAADDDGDERYWGRVREINNAWDAVGDLERNCFPLALSGYAKLSHIGRLVYMPVAYERFLERKTQAEQRESARAAAAASSEYVGEVGKRLTITTASAELVTSWEGFYGVTFLYRFTDEGGNVFVWRASRSIEVSDNMTIKGTVKEHSEYNGVKQTVISRCAVA